MSDSFVNSPPKVFVNSKIEHKGGRTYIINFDYDASVEMSTKKEILA